MKKLMFIPVLLILLYTTYVFAEQGILEQQALGKGPIQGFSLTYVQTYDSPTGPAGRVGKLFHAYSSSHVAVKVQCNAAACIKHEYSTTITRTNRSCWPIAANTTETTVKPNKAVFLNISSPGGTVCYVGVMRSPQ